MTPQRVRPDRVVLAPPAKLNLHLEILFKRPDGYHEIESVMQAVTLTDHLAVERVAGEGVTLSVTGRECPTDGNLVVTAAQRWFAATGSSFGLRIALEKKIPLGAGLGGGSSDAASMLLALSRLDDSPLEGDRLDVLAAEIGSDVPFFLHCGQPGLPSTAIVRGRGERIEPVPNAPRFVFVVLYPGVVTPTARVYANVNLDLTQPRKDLRNSVLMTNEVRAGGPAVYNALESSFRSLYPELQKLQDLVSKKAGLEFRVTGSGSAMFASVKDHAQGKRVVRALQALAAGETFLCETLLA